MKQFKKFFFALTLISAVLFSACNDISMDESQSDSDGRAYISVSVKDFARLISPTNTEEKDIVLVNLYSKKSGATGETGEAELVKEWEATESNNALEVMNSDDPILFETGTYDFTLKLYVKNKYASGSVVSQEATITKEIKAGQNELVFNTKYAGETGFVNIKLYWWNGVSIKVDKASAALYAVNDDLSIGEMVGDTETGLEITDYDGESSSTTDFAVTYQSAVAAGDYYIIFKLKRAGAEIYDTWSELIKVVNGAYTEAEKEFENPNVYYAIKYMTPGESESGWVEVADSTNTEATHWNEGVEPVTVRNINTTVPLPTGTQITRPNETKDGQISRFEFDGWYEGLDADGNIVGTALTSIGTGDGTERDYTLYAKWKEKVDMTFSVSIETDDSSDITVTNNAASLTDTNLVFTVDTTAGKYDTYTWKVDGVTQTETGSELTFNMLGKASGVYDVSLLATKTGDDNKTEYYSYLAQIEWTRKYMVDFVTNKVGSEAVSQYFAEGGTEKVTEPVDSEKVAISPTYGWYTSTDDGATLSKTPYDFENAEAPTSSFTLYGLWEITEFYVSAEGTDESDVTALEGYGIESKPLATIAGAVALMNDSTKDYTIYVDGKLTGEQKIQKSNELTNGGLAQSITLCGKNGIDSETDLPKDSLNGSNSGRTLTVSSDVPVTISGLLITGGYGDTDTWGGGLSVSNGSEVTLSKDAYIQKNTASRGGGINVDGTLIMLDGSVISDNKSTEVYGGGVYVGSSGVLDMRGGEISGNGFTVTSSNNQGAGVYVCGSSGTIKLSGPAQINKNNAVHLSAYTHLTISGALTGDSPVVTIEPVGYSTETQWVVLEEGANTTLSAECGKIAVASDGTNDWRINEAGYLQQIADIDGVVSQITSMTKSGTISVSGYVEDGDSLIENISSALDNLYTQKSEIEVDLDLSGLENLTRVPTLAFFTNGSRGRHNLVSITLPEGVTEIGEYAFRDCGITSISLPKSLTEIEGNAFYDCPSLKTVTLAEGNSAFKKEGNILYTADGTELVMYCDKTEEAELTIPATVTKIGSFAFQGSNVKSIAFEEDSALTELGSDVFYGCSKLASISLPDTVSTVGNECIFKECASLKTFKVPESLKKLTYLFFYSCTSLESVELPAGLTTIENGVFGGCSALDFIYFWGTEEQKENIIIGSGNDALTKATWVCNFNGTIPVIPIPITLNKGTEISAAIASLFTDITTDDTFAFAKSTSKPSEASVYLDSGNKIPVWLDTETKSVYYYAGSAYTLVLNADSSEMFKGCSKLSSIDASAFDTSNVTNMRGMFADCSKLTSLDLSTFNTSSVRSMASMFDDCTYLETLTLGENFTTGNVTDMSSMFYDCSALTSLDLSTFNTSSVETMASMFEACKELRTLTLGDNFTTANVTDMSSMFSSCEWLRPLDVSKFNTSNVTDMSYMFNKCEYLETLDVSNFNTSKVTNMAYMFKGCSALTSLDLSNFDASALVVPTTDDYKSNTDFMFYGCTALSSVVLPSTGLTKLGYCEFDSDTNLTSITIPATVTEIGERAFYGCTGLTSIVIPASVTTIGAYAFDGCKNLTAINCRGAESSITRGAAWKPSTATVNYNYGKISLKSGSVLNGLFMQIKDKGNSIFGFAKASSLDGADYTIVTSVFGSTETAYLDAENKSVPFWVDAGTIYYYVEDGFTLLVGNGSNMFAGDSFRFNTIDVSDFDVSQATSLDGMFSNSGQLTTIYAKAGTDWSATAPSGVTGESMFLGCNSLTNYDSEHTEISRAFVGTKDGVTGYFTAKE